MQYHCRQTHIPHLSGGLGPPPIDTNELQAKVEVSIVCVASASWHRSCGARLISSRQLGSSGARRTFASDTSCPVDGSMSNIKSGELWSVILPTHEKGSNRCALQDRVQSSATGRDLSVSKLTILVCLMLTKCVSLGGPCAMSIGVNTISWASDAHASIFHLPQTMSTDPGRQPLS